MFERRGVAVTALMLWLALLLVTHRGQRSPYSYCAPAYILGHAVWAANDDALTVVPVTRWFYDGTTPEWRTAHNIHLPLHSFATAVATSGVRPYLLANDLVNLFFLFVLVVAALRIADRYGVRRGAFVLAFATILLLPPVVDYIGQPMQYIAGTVINTLVILAAAMLPDDDLRNPWISGALTAILTVNYDWYMFGVALAVYVLFVVRFRRLTGVMLYALVSLLPLLGWKALVRWMTAGAASAAVQSVFFANVFSGLFDMLAAPLRRPVFPFALTHVGAGIGFTETLGLIYWPLIVACLVALWLGHPRLTVRPALLFVLLTAFFVLEQLATAGFDPENNPRRAIPVVVAFAWAYCWATGRFAGDRRWKIAFVLLLVLSTFLSYSDVLTGSPANMLLSIGETVRGEPKDVLTDKFQTPTLRFDPVEAKQQVLLGSFPRAHVQPTLPFVAAQLFCAAMFLALFYLLARATLMPRWAPVAAAGVIAVSWILRFL